MFLVKSPVISRTSSSLLVAANAAEFAPRGNRDGPPPPFALSRETSSRGSFGQRNLKREQTPPPSPSHPRPAIILERIGLEIMVAL